MAQQQIGFINIAVQITLAAPYKMGLVHADMDTAASESHKQELIAFSMNS